jgi:RimJ/RimL family protein N-acetyltransferase
MDYIIREATRADRVAMYAISLRAHTSGYYDTLIPASSKVEFDEHYSQSRSRLRQFNAAMNRKINNDSWQIYVACINKKVVGYTVAHRINEQQVIFKGLFVDPASHGKGIGSALFAATVEWAGDSRIEFTVLAKNVIAKSIYKKFGFNVSGKAEKTFFAAPLDVMKRSRLT